MCFRKRLLAFFIDYFILCILFAINGGMLLCVDTGLIPQDFTKYVLFCGGIILLLIILLFIAKDAINGQSIGKKLMKIKVVDAHGKTPNIFKLIIRNITIYIWPIEAILVLLNKKKLGDRLAGTNIVELTTTHNTRDLHLCGDNL